MRSPDSVSAPSAAPRICLSMIVRNESAVIERCLKAALPLCDAAVICDTGSTDATPELAHQLLSTTGIPFGIVQHAWHDFGTNRTAALREATRFVHERGWPLERTYWLLLDADLELMISSSWSRALLDSDAIALRQRSSTLACWNLRLARASLDWRAVGRTHERYACASQPVFQQITSLWVRDHADGGSRSDKFSRDIAWLTGQLAETPDDPRTIFYLAQSYRAIGDPLKALILYRRRAAIADGHDEVWYSHLCIGQILADTDQLDAAIAALMEAEALVPGRAETAYELSRLHLRQRRVAEAVAVAERGRGGSAVDQRFHFVHADIHDYKLDLQLASSAVDTVHAERGFAACDRVALSRLSPREALEQTQQLAVRYAAPIRGMEFLPLQPTITAPYRPCNPSIVRTDAGYLVLCRTVNYEQRRLRYRSFDDDQVYRTRNVLLRLDASFQVVAESELTLDAEPLRHAMVRGLEDCRLVQCRGELLFTCATMDRHPSGVVNQSICQLGADGHVTRHRPLVGAFDGTIQKNWLPFVADETLYAIYGYDPFTLLRLSPDSGEYNVAQRTESAVNGIAWRGSAGPLAWPDGAGRPGHRLVLVHEAIRRQGADAEWERIYLHRFVEYDAAFRVTRVSRPFIFAHKGVEFACGMTCAHGGLELIVALGIEDREAYLGRIAFTQLDRMLDTTRVA